MKVNTIEQTKVGPESWSVFPFDATQTKGGQDVLEDAHIVAERCPVLTLAGLVVRAEVENSRLAFMAKRGGDEAGIARSSRAIADDRILLFAKHNGLQPEQAETALGIAELAIGELHQNPEQPFDLWQILSDYQELARGTADSARFESRDESNQTNMQPAH